MEISMHYTVFNQQFHDQMTEPMFLGKPLNISRYDQQKYPFFEQLIEKQLSFFWRPEEVDLGRDRIDYTNLPAHEQHIFISNLKYQTLLDSIQGRSPNATLLPIVSIPELETWITAWTFFEAIHSRSYTHIIRNIVNDPSIVFDGIIDNEHILARAEDIARYYDELYQAVTATDKDLRDIKKKLYLCMLAINALEGIRFYVSFACSFSFAERKCMEGNAKIIKLIARDESLHLNGAQAILNLWKKGADDPEMADIANECHEQAIAIFDKVAQQEKDWAKYLFKDGSMIGLNEHILTQYVEYITNVRMDAIGLPYLFEHAKNNPIPWINTWLSSDDVQVAPQETEITTYLVGQIDASLSENEFNGFTL